MKDSKILNKKIKKEKSEIKEFDDKINISAKTDVCKIKFLQNLSNDDTYFMNAGP